MKYKSFLMRCSAISLIFIFCSAALAQTSEQKRYAERLDTTREIQNDIYDFQHQARYCAGGEQKPYVHCAGALEHALNTNCINKKIYDILSTQTFKVNRRDNDRSFYYPQCGIGPGYFDFSNPVFFAACKCG